MTVLLRQRRRRKVFIANCILTKPSKCIFNAEHTHYCYSKGTKKTQPLMFQTQKKCTHGNLCAFSWKKYRGIRHKIHIALQCVCDSYTSEAERIRSQFAVTFSHSTCHWFIHHFLLLLLEFWSIVYVFLFYSENYCCMDESFRWLWNHNIYIYMCVSTKLSQWDGVHRCKWREMYFTQA